MVHEAADCGPALERFRDYLHLLTRLQLDPRWQGKVDLSGVVQQTLFEAQRAWEQLRSWDEARQMAWLRRALAHNLTDEVRKLGACRRGAAPERSLDQALEEALLRRKQARWRVAEAVIAGQLSLAEAIDIFRALDREWPENRPWPHAPAHVEISQDEWDGRGVLNSVRQVLADRPAEAAAAADCLERELQQLLADRKKRPPATAEPRTERSR